VRACPEDRIRAHVHLCWLALLLIRAVETATGRGLIALVTEQVEEPAKRVSPLLCEWRGPDRKPPSKISQAPLA
jgi:hypothetical protein